MFPPDRESAAMSGKLSRIPGRAGLLVLLALAFLRPGVADAQANRDRPEPRPPAVERITPMAQRKATGEPPRMRRADRPRIDPPRQDQ